jgi:hypothetical protein
VSEELYQTTPLENPTHQPSSSVFVFIGSFHDDVSVCLGFHRLRKREVSEGGTAAGATVFNCQIFPFSKKVWLFGFCNYCYFGLLTQDLFPTVF